MKRCLFSTSIWGNKLKQIRQTSLSNSGFSSEGRAKLRDFLRDCILQNTQLSLSPTWELGIWQKYYSRHSSSTPRTWCASCFRRGTPWSSRETPAGKKTETALKKLTFLLSLSHNSSSWNSFINTFRSKPRLVSNGHYCLLISRCATKLTTPTCGATPWDIKHLCCAGLLVPYVLCLEYRKNFPPKSWVYAKFDLTYKI